MPFRVDLHDAGDDVFDRLVELDAIDVERSADGAIAALLPDRVSPREIAAALGRDDFAIAPARGRDAGSLWILHIRPFRVGGVEIVPVGRDEPPGASRLDAPPRRLRLIDAAVFGTGLHPTTALCLEALEEIVRTERPQAVLDVGTGSGVLALAALLHGVPRAVALDIDDEALVVAAANARLNGLDGRVMLQCVGPDRIPGTWPLVLANVLAAPLIEMAPALVRRVGRRGHLVLSGIPLSLEHDVDRRFRNLGMRRVRANSRAGWIAMVVQASW